MDRCRRQVCCVLHDTQTCARAYTHTHTYIHTYTHTHLRASAREVPKRAIDHRRCVCPGVVCRGLRVCPRVFECVCVCVCVCVRACVRGCACVPGREASAYRFSNHACAGGAAGAAPQQHGIPCARHRLTATGTDDIGASSRGTGTLCVTTPVEAAAAPPFAPCGGRGRERRKARGV